MIDAVIVSNCTTSYLWKMTQNAIRTLRATAGVKIGKVVVVEQCLDAPPQDAKMLYYNFEFNYNRCLNLGRSICRSQYIAFCNNDLYFTDHWAKNAIIAMRKHDCLSASPTNRHIFAGVREGYFISKTLLGWCIITDRRVFDHIGKFDEAVKFWYSDDVYAIQLQLAGIKHILVGNSQVKHLGSITLMKIRQKRSELMRGQKKLFEQYKLKKYANTGIKIETGKG